MATQDIRDLIAARLKGSSVEEAITIQALNDMLDEIDAAAGGGSTVAWDDVTDKPEVIAAGTTPAEARAAIGAGTSDLTIGTTSTTAKAGDYQPAWGDVTNKPSTFPATPASVVAAVSAKTEVAALTAIADPSIATAEDVANAVNSVIAALQA